MSDDRTKALEKQQQFQREQAELQMAHSQASSTQLPAENSNPRMVELLGDANIGDDPQLERLTAPETSRTLMFGQIDEEELERRKPLNQNLSERVKSEFPERNGVGSKCTGEYRQIMTGDRSEGDRKPLTPEMGRKVDSTLGEEGVRTNMLGLSVGAKAFDGLTKIQSEAFTHNANNGTSSGGGGGGIVGSAKSLLFGGD